MIDMTDGHDENPEDCIGDPTYPSDPDWEVDTDGDSDAGTVPAA
jgi:hypothetical protein